MLTLESNIIRISVLGREYKILCNEDKIKNLNEATQYLNNTISKMQTNNKLITFEHIIIVVALNIINELLIEKNLTQSLSNSLKEISEKISLLNLKINQIMNE